MTGSRPCTGRKRDEVGLRVYSMLQKVEKLPKDRVRALQFRTQVRKPLGQTAIVPQNKLRIELEARSDLCSIAEVHETGSPEKRDFCTIRDFRNS